LGKLSGPIELTKKRSKKLRTEPKRQNTIDTIPQNITDTVPTRNETSTIGTYILIPILKMLIMEYLPTVAPIRYTK